MMIEKTVLDYLNANSTIPWYMETPAKPPKKFGIVQKTGSSVNNFIYHATIALQTHAGTLYEAAELNEEVKGLMDNIISLPKISASRLNSDYAYTNPAAKQSRYQAVYDLVHYGG